MNKRTIIIFACIIGMTVCGVVFAKPSYYGQLILTYSNIKSSRIDFCLCHNNKSGGGPRNPYGLDFAKYNNFKDIEKLDSDSDGFTNIVEINALTHPGDQQDFPKSNDSTPPIIQIDYPTEGMVIINNTFKVTGSATDNQTVRDINVTIDDTMKTARYVGSKWEAEFTIKRGGPKTAKVIATDPSGNKGEAVVNFILKLPDKQAPIINILFPSDGTTIDSLPFLIRGMAGDENTVILVEYSIDNGKIWNKTTGIENWQVAINMAPEGEFRIWVRATDDNGNVSVPVMRHFFIKLPEVPTPSITFPNNGLIIEQGDIVINGTVALPAISVRVRLDNQQPVEAKIEGSFWTIELSGFTPGEHKVEACAYDRLNRRSKDCVIATFTYKIRDFDPPIINIKSPKNGEEFELGNITVSGTAFDSSGVLKVEVSTDGIKWEMATGKAEWTYAFTATESKTYKILVRATDELQNTTKTPVAVNINVLTAFKIIIGQANEKGLEGGLLEVLVTFTRKPDNEPIFKLSGSTANLNAEDINVSTYKITAMMGGGATELLVSAKFKDRSIVQKAKFTYRVQIILVIGQKVMMVNGMRKDIPSAATILAGRTYIPFRSIGEAIRADVSWDDKTRTATYKLGTIEVKLRQNVMEAELNGKMIKINSPPVIKDGRLMIPVRTFADLLDGLTEYDNKTRTVTLTLPKP